MIPIKNRKKTLEVTVEEMRNLSFSYLEKFSPSKQQLKTYLLKKIFKIFKPKKQKPRYYSFNRCSFTRFRKNKIYK